MRHLFSPTPRHARLDRTFQGLLCAMALAALVACGGGGSSSDSASSGATTAYAAGPITGFGSVIVNGVRFDDSRARVSDDDGNSRRADELRLGMMAEVQSSGITTDSSGSRGDASAIRIGSEIVGPVAQVAADRSALVVLGVTVRLTSTTLIDDRLVGGLAGLVAGSSVVEIHALFDASTGTYTATRVEPKPNAPFYKLRGAVSGLDTAARTFRIGSGTDTIGYDAIRAAVPAALANGQLVRVRLQTAKVGGQWVAASIVTGAPKLDDHDEAELEGSVTASSFATDRRFSVNGVPVDARNATFPKGSAGIVVGARVEVKGSAVGGVVIATRVSIEDTNKRERDGFELHGALSDLNPTAKTFLLRGVTVGFASVGEFRNGSAADLANGRKVEVKGARSSDGTTLVATRIGFED